MLYQWHNRAIITRCNIIIIVVIFIKRRALLVAFVSNREANVGALLSFFHLCYECEKDCHRSSH